MSNKIYELREMLCEELDKIAGQGELSAGQLETAHKLTDTIKNIDKICMVEEGGYSGDGEWNAMGTYGRGNSFRGQSRNRLGQYGGTSYRGNSMRRGYSREGEMEHIETKMREVLDSGNLTAAQQDAVQRAMDMLRDA